MVTEPESKKVQRASNENRMGENTYIIIERCSFCKTFFYVRNIRYWHITSYLGANVPFIQPVLNAVDQILSRIPVIRLMHGFLHLN